MTAPTTARGLGFMPKGYRLAVAHYNGVSLWFPNVEAAPTVLEWKGSHLDVVASPDGRFVVSSMQENALHGWRVADSRNMRMTGYPRKTRSLSWSHDGQWLATSGADACIVWPFRDKDGPMGKAPRECGVRRAKVSQVAFHPRALVVAVGYEDGFILLCRLGDAGGDSCARAWRQRRRGDRAGLGRARRPAGVRPRQRGRRRADASRVSGAPGLGFANPAGSPAPAFFKDRTTAKSCPTDSRKEFHEVPTPPPCSPPSSSAICNCPTVSSWRR